MYEKESRYEITRYFALFCRSKQQLFNKELHDF